MRCTGRRFPPHGAQLGAHPCIVCRGPVNAPAVRAAHEAFLAGKHVWGHAVLHGGLVNRHHGLVATDATCEQLCERIELERFHHLPQLIAKVIAFYQLQSRRRGFPQQAVVTCEDRASLAARVARQCPARQVRAIRGILPDDPQPVGQAPEHLIDRESRRHDIAPLRIVGTA